MSTPETNENKLTFTAGKEEINGVLYPAAGTGARYIWDLADKAHEAGKSSSDIMDVVTRETTMTRGTVSSQLTYWRKSTGKTLAKKVDHEKVARDAAKAEEKRLKAEEKAKERAAKAEAKAEEAIRKAEEKAEQMRVKAEEARAKAAGLSADVQNEGQDVE